MTALFTADSPEDFLDTAATLAELRMARMVTTRQDGTRVHYRLVDEHATQLVHAAILHAEHAVDAAPRHHQRSQTAGG